MRIAVDAFGGDYAPLEIVKGAADASRAFGTDITLVGNRERLESLIQEHHISFDGDLKIVHADDVISMHDDPTSILKAHKDCSMALAFKELCEDRADAFVSAGSTGALVVGGTLLVKRIRGIKRPALGGLLPTPDGGCYLLMDMGANAECRPEMLCQFGVMASVYMEKVVGIESPTVGLLNIGTEDTKGDALRKESYALLQKAPIHFIGNVESREMPKGVCDALVTDGFTGNIALKLIEGTAYTLFGLIKGVMTKSLRTKLAAAVLKKDLTSLKTVMDATEIGGAPLLGVRKTVIKAHGNSDAKAMKNAIGQAVMCVKAGVPETIAHYFDKGDDTDA